MRARPLDHVTKQNQRSVGFVGSEGAQVPHPKKTRADSARPSGFLPSTDIINTHYANHQRGMASVALLSAHGSHFLGSH